MGSGPISSSNSQSHRMMTFVNTLVPTSAVNLGSYFLQMSNNNQRGGILKQRGVKLLDMEIAFLPVHSHLHWTIFVMRPKAKLVEYYNSFGNEDTDWRAKVQAWTEEQLERSYVAKEWKWGQRKSPEQRDVEACGVFTCMNAFCACISRQPLSVYGQAHVPQLRDHIGAVILNGGYVGELAIMGITTG